MKRQAAVEQHEILGLVEERHGVGHEVARQARRLAAVGHDPDAGLLRPCVERELPEHDRGIAAEVAPVGPGLDRRLREPQVELVADRPDGGVERSQEGEQGRGVGGVETCPDGDVTAGEQVHARGRCLGPCPVHVRQNDGDGFSPDRKVVRRRGSLAPRAQNAVLECPGAVAHVAPPGRVYRGPPESPPGPPARRRLGSSSEPSAR